MDFGLKHFITTSDGDIIDNPETYKHSLGKLTKLSRDFSRKQKNSKSRKKTKVNLIKMHKQIVNQRSDFQWKLAHRLCGEYSYIAIEDLNLRGMQKMWGRKISDLGYGEFINKLEYIGKKYGTEVIKIDRFAASSQICHCCGYKNIEVKSLNIRKWVCPKCGETHDRDINAAKNILNIGKNGKGISQGRSNSKTLLSGDNNAVALIAEDSHDL